MKDNLSISCILATYGRQEEVLAFITSLESQTLPTSQFELIIVDQNSENILDEYVAKFSSSIKIVHIRSSVKGLSTNRNIGLSYAQGAYVCFPDDDCTYYPDTLSNALEKLKSTNKQMILGAIRDRSTGEKLIKNWPDIIKTVNRWNFQRYSTSITIFAKRNDLKFCEALGAGTSNGSCEDLDYIYKSIKTFGPAIYFPDLDVWHPAPEISEIPSNKVASYGRGFGKFCRINSPDMAIASILILTLTYHATQFFIELTRLNIRGAKNRAIAFSSRAISFLYRDKSWNQ
ncbi:glycosyl transferase [Pseudomonas sp. GM33]|uniref:glycosyltransferase family 2 protein n=1 Tax=Pseudomonas sp. GM33 TaxID=1144329 RepID=UPI0002704CDA|nr:glycosyltransferase family 2 protein [Pseudomonas sp. GM33]EJM43521.1 glycosyl transferase [Pseudomonas sp. GM33]